MALSFGHYSACAAVFCGVEVIRHAGAETDRSFHLSTHAVWMADQRRLVFPTIAGLSSTSGGRAGSGAQSVQTRLISVHDGGEQIGLQWKVEADVKLLATDPLPPETLVGLSSLVVAGDRGRSQPPQLLTASVSGAGRVLISISDESAVAGSYVNQRKRAGEGVSTRDRYLIELAWSEIDGKIQAVSLAKSGENRATLFLATESTLYSADLPITGIFLATPSPLGLTRLVSLPGTHFLKALDRRTVVAADAFGNVAVITNSTITLTAKVPVATLIALDAYRIQGTPRIWASGTADGFGVKQPLYVLRDDKFVDSGLHAGEGERVVAIAGTSISLSDDSYWIEGSDNSRMAVDDGELKVARFESGRVILERVLLGVMRPNGELSIRGLMEMDGTQVFHEPRWAVREEDRFPNEEKHLLRAGFDMKLLRESVSTIGDIKPGLLTRLTYLDYGDPFDAKHPGLYRPAEPLFHAWRRRLLYLRDLREVTAGYSASLTRMGFKSFPDQLLAYEVTELARIERAKVDAAYVDDLLDLRAALKNKVEQLESDLSEFSASLNSPIGEVYDELLRLFETRLSTVPHVTNGEINYEKMNTVPGRILYLTAEHYVGRPFVHWVPAFLEFCRGSEFDSQGKHRNYSFATVLEAFLQEQDPLRKLVDTAGLIKFLKNPG